MQGFGGRLASVVMAVALMAVGCSPEDVGPSRYGGPGTSGYVQPQPAPTQIIYQQPQQTYQQPQQAHHDGGAFSDPPPSVSGGGGRPQTSAAPPGRYVAVTWSKPNGYMPAAHEKACRAGYLPANYPGKTLCVVCPAGAGLHYLNNDYYCASCPSGTSYYVYGSKQYCRG